MHDLMTDRPKHVLKWSHPKIEMPFRLIPAGTFRMGSRGGRSNEEPSHVVRIVHDFWIAETPVTQAQFALWTGSSDYEQWCGARTQPDRHVNGFDGRPDHPAERMTMYEALGFCDWLTRQAQAGIENDMVAGLPSEAQWEYACRAGTDTDYWSGDGEAALAQVGWYFGNSGKQTHPVGEKHAPNPWGLHDMHGNVAERCRDVWDDGAYRGAHRVDGITDSQPTAPREDGRIDFCPVRGGLFDVDASGCRSAARCGGGMWARNYDEGFRCCLFRSR